VSGRGPTERVSAAKGAPSAEIHIIGDEILAATYPERNSSELLRLLRSAGIRCRRVLFLPDDPRLVADELRRALRTCDWVFTAGGIGPTHDDRTLEAVALALGRPLGEDPRLLAVMAQRHPEGLTEGHRKMARVPQGCDLLSGGHHAFPLLRCDRIYVLPGVPRLLADKLLILRGLFEGTPPPTEVVSVRLPETTLKPHLDRLVAAHPDVKVGSYPVAPRDHPCVEVILEAPTAPLVAAAAADLRVALGGSTDRS